jgi:hypothetical protein
MPWPPAADVVLSLDAGRNNAVHYSYAHVEGRLISLLQTGRASGTTVNPFTNPQTRSLYRQSYRIEAHS